MKINQVKSCFIKALASLSLSYFTLLELPHSYSYLRLIYFLFEFCMPMFLFYVYFLGCIPVIVAPLHNVYGSLGTTRLLLPSVLFISLYSKANPFQIFYLSPT